MIPGRVYTPATIAGILRRRVWLLLGCFGVATAAAAWMALSLPDVYRGSTTILVAPSRVPERARSVVPESIEQRLTSIMPQILNPPRLERIITELDLYPEMRKEAPPEQVVEMMRRSITVDVVRADAFRVNYYGYWPEKVMQVTQRLSALFVDENLKNREKQAADTSQFLDTQLEETRRRLVEQERELQEYRTINAAALPSQIAANLQVLKSTQDQLQALQESMGRDRERRFELEQALLEVERRAQAADAASADPETDEPGVAGPDAPDAPDVNAGTPATGAEAASSPNAAASTKAEAGAPAPAAPAEVDLNFGPPGTPAAVRLQNARRYLQGLQMRYSPAHPDVVRAQRLVSQFEKAALEQTARSGGRGVGVADQARAASIAAASRRLAAIDKEIATKAAEQARLRKAEAEYQSRVERGPAHEARLIALTRDYDIVRDTYRGLLAKKEESGIVADLERHQGAEQFRILEPARLPQRPTSPDRTRIILLGIGIGLALGLGLTVLVELRDQSFRTAPEVVHVLSLPVLAMVPAISTRYERRAFIRRLGLGVALLTIVALVGGGVFALRGWW